jgi:hypothetical protein
MVVPIEPQVRREPAIHTDWIILAKIRPWLKDRAMGDAYVGPLSPRFGPLFGFGNGLGQQRPKLWDATSDRLGSIPAFRGNRDRTEGSGY